MFCADLTPPRRTHHQHPVSLQRVRAMTQEGVLQPQSLVWAAHLPSWSSVDDAGLVDFVDPSRASGAATAAAEGHHQQESQLAASIAAGCAAMGGASAAPSVSTSLVPQPLQPLRLRSTSLVRGGAGAASFVPSAAAPSPLGSASSPLALNVPPPEHASAAPRAPTPGASTPFTPSADSPTAAEQDHVLQMRADRTMDVIERGA